MGGVGGWVRALALTPLSVSSDDTYNERFAGRRVHQTPLPPLFDNWGRPVSTGQGRFVVARRGRTWASLIIVHYLTANDSVAGRIGFAPVRMAA